MNGTILDSLFKPITDMLRQTVEGAMDAFSESILVRAEKLITGISKKMSAAVYSALFFGTGAIVLLIGAGQLIDFLTKITGIGFVMAGGCLLLLGAYYKGKINGRKRRTN